MSSTADEAALARNLLHSVLALAFPDELTGSGDDVAAQQLFLAHLAQLKRVLAQRRVFELAASSAALAKFHARLWALLEKASDARVRAAALELQLLVLQQCALEPLEQLTPKLVERVTRVLRQQQQSAAVAPALDVAAALVRHIELLSPEVRRDLYDSFAKLLPPALSQLQALGAKSELARSDVQLWTSGVRLFVELLEVSPNALRIYSGKIEQVCALLFQFPDAFTREDSGEIGALATGAKCLGLLANASDKTPQQWKQIVERAVEVVHLQVDSLSGKRAASSSSSSQQQSTLRGWIKDSSTASDALLSVYQRAELALQRFEVAAAAISEMMKNRLISEREVQLVITDMIALVRRALAVRAMEIGKQTAVSEDGFRLPASVVYGILPRVQELSLRILASTVERAGICALRHASKIVRVLRLAGENGARDSQDALYAAIGVCVRSLGASTVEKLGVPLLEEMVARCKADLANAPSAAASQENGDSGASSAGALAEKKGGRNSKGKKRKRQAEGGVAQLAEAADSLPFVSSHSQLLLARSVDAALASIATCVSVYGSTLPLEARSAASDLVRFAVQQRARQKFLSSAAAAATSDGGMDAVALLLLSDAVSADSTGAHGANLIAGMRYWQEHARHAPVLNGSSSLSTTLQLVALSAGDALLHPRAPPLSINFQDAVDAKKAAKLQQQQRMSGYASSATRSSKGSTASGVRGHNDWNDEVNGDGDKKSDGDAGGDDDVVKKAAVDAKKLKADAVAADEQQTDVKGEDKQAEEDEEDEEEDYDDVRPTDSAVQEGDDEEMPEEEESSSPVAKVPVATTTNNDDDDDDDDEFPDIVVDEDDE